MNLHEDEAGKDLSWHELERKELWQGRLFRLLESRQVQADGREGRFTVMECPDWVNVLALDTKAGGPRVVLVRQFRFGGMTMTSEFPGGVVEPGEEPEAAARRELQEECGLQARTWIPLGSVNPNPSFMANTTHSFLALDLALDRRGRQPDALEALSSRWWPLEEILAGKVGELGLNGVMFTTLWWFSRWLQDNPGRIPGY